MKIHWIQHVAFEKLGNIEEWIQMRNHELSCTRQYVGESLPNPDEFDFLIVMGGPMGVYDTDIYPWLSEELDFIKEVIQQSKPVLGICLGAQFIASALQVKVYQGSTKEIGWFPIQLIPNSILHFNSNNPAVFHWHGDTFDLPPQANLLASTPEVPNQAFIYNNKVIGLQFHLEQTDSTLEAMLDNCGSELNEVGIKIQSSQGILEGKKYIAENKQAMFSILDYLSKQI
jgi:GMP synthase-like glutamine amidotransferase